MKIIPFSLAALMAVVSFTGLVPVEAAPAKGKSASAAKSAAKPATPKEVALEAELDIQPQELAPAATIEVRFPTPMIAPDRVGQAEIESPLVVEPALAGEFKWTSTRSARYRLTQPPKFNASYAFKLRAGLKDLEGKALSTEQLNEVSSAPFRIIDQYPKWFDRSSTSRTPRFLLEFNDQVNPGEAAKAIAFNCGETKVVVPARARHATGKDFSDFGAEAQPTWAEEVSGVKPAVAPDGARLSALVVEAESPLPVGKNWTLAIQNTLKNLSGHDALAAGDSVVLGEVTPFTVTLIDSHTPFDQEYYLSIVFSKPVASGRYDTDPKEREELAKKIAAAVKIEPAVEISGISADWRTVTLLGKFALKQDYKVTVNQGLESRDGLPLQAVASSVVEFFPNPPYVSAPSFINAQLATGGGEFELSVANVRQARVRAKRLNGPELLQAIEKFQPYVRAFNGSREKREEFEPEAFEDYPGVAIYDRTFPINKPLDRSELIKLSWREILGEGKTGPLFVEIEGTASEGAGEQDVIAQTLVEFTDIGLMQKSNGRESLVFAVSLKTGKPVPGARITLVDGERRLIAIGDTNAEGLAIVRGEEPKFVVAEKDGDCTAIQLENYDAGIPLWSFGLDTAWRSPWDTLRRTFVFSDRPVYRPGETGHFKAYTRTLLGDDLRLDEEAVKGRLVLRDPRYRVVLQKDVSFTANGSWNDSLVLPEGPTGHYTLELSFPEAEGEEGDEGGQNGRYTFRIDEYRPNTFEVKLESDKLDLQPDRLKLPLRANYYMGKPLSLAKVSWNAHRADDYLPPESFYAYHFGDAPSWAGYGLDRGSSRDEDDSGWDAYGDVTLGEDGTAILEMPAPPPDRAAMPQIIEFGTEVTDVNQQTISTSTQFKVPGADFILGLKGPESFGTTGKEVPLEIIAITPEGKPAPGAALVDVKIERQSYHTIKIATAGGGSTTKDQVVLQSELQQQTQLKAVANGQPPSATIAFKPTRSGTYFITAESVDGSGRKLLSRMPFYVLGGGEFPWSLEDGSAITLQPDKKELKPGEEATIVVKTPIAGTALVTVERNRFHRQFLTTLSPENPVIKVPVQDAESPNVFVSVIVIRGAEGSPKQHKMPEYRIGYCELTVNSTAKNLVVEVKPERDTVKPGEQVNVAGTALDGAKKPVAGADVTLFAVDEGVLSLMSFVTPDPKPFFHEPFALAVKNWTSFDGLLPEDVAERVRGNKGFLVGGGGEDEANIVVRKNFVATPLWLASATSDAQGRISASFKAPDNLTRYRIMAVAAAGADRFGNGESFFTINKPLMVEPVVPRFARLGDEVLVKAVVHNTTPHSGEVEVELKLDEKSAFITEPRSFIPASLGAQSGDVRSQKHTLTLKAGETAATTFAVRFDKLGSTKWQWTARTTKWPAGAPAQNDGTESIFNVNHPMPELREVRYVRLDSKTPIDNLLKDVSPQLLEGDGAVEISASASRLSETRDALDYVLKYPYGCVEQTSSSTLPWLALGGFHELFPEHLSQGQAKAAVQAGASRLLQMVTEDGGLAYWPGGQESNQWGSAYGGFTLLRARDAGASVPEEVIKKLLDYLSKSLRNLEDEKDPYALTNATMALYTLAKGGRAEAAYENLLYAKRDQLPEIARLYLSLSMLIHKAPEQQVKDLLGWKPKPAPEVKKAVPATAKGKKPAAKPAAKPAPPPAPVWTHWWGNQMNKALRLIAYTHLGLREDADALATSILLARNGRGEWGNTITNAWTLTAMAAYERSNKTAVEPLALRVLWDNQDVPLNLPTLNSTAKAAFVLNAGLAAKPLTASIPEGRTAFARIESKAFARTLEFAGVNRGYNIIRTYSELLPDGSVTPADDLRVGDMVLVNLEIAIGGDDRYLAISDPLPSVFEAVNPEFDTQGGKTGERAEAAAEPWFCDHREIRTDRALFFTDYAPGKGKFALSYLARVIAEGDTMAPPARIEAMYQPDKHGLSAAQRIVTLPSGGGKSVAGK